MLSRLTIQCILPLLLIVCRVVVVTDTVMEPVALSFKSALNKKIGIREAIKRNWIVVSIIKKEFVTMNINAIKKL